MDGVSLFYYDFKTASAKVYKEIIGYGFVWDISNFIERVNVIRAAPAESEGMKGFWRFVPRKKGVEAE